MTTEEQCPFAGLTVLDVSQGMAGPRAAQVLAEQGARVIKVEPPDGDWARNMGRRIGDMTAIFASSNAGKESVVLDTRTDADRHALVRLAERADVVVESYRPGVAARMGLDAAQLRQKNPALVVVSVNGFGSIGPLVAVPAVDTVLQASAGLMAVNADASGVPRRIGLFLIDLFAAAYAAQQVAAALYRVARTGHGRHIEVTLLEATAALLSYQVLDASMFPGEPVRTFNAPSGVFPAADGGFVYVGALTTSMFHRLAAALGIEEWLTDPDLQQPTGRVRRVDEVHERLAAVLATASADAWELRLAEVDVLVSRVRQPGELPDHPQAGPTGLFTELSLGGITVPWASLPGAGGGLAPKGSVPALGQHTDSVLAELGLDR